MAIDTRNIIEFSDFKKRYKRKNPHRVPKEVDTGRSWVPLVMLSVVLLMVNILSAGHTVVIIQKFYSDMPPWVTAVISFAGFIGIEGTIVYFMASEDRSRWEKGSILIAFIAACSTNLYGVFEVVETGESVALVAIALILGLFPPIANIGIGEVYHKKSVERRKRIREAEREYAEMDAQLNQAVENAYRTLLKKQGVGYVGATQLILGMDLDPDVEEAIEEEEEEEEEKKGDPEGQGSKVLPSPTKPRKKKSRKKTSSSAGVSAEKVAELIEKGDLEDLTWSQMQDKVEELTGGRPSTATISKAKKQVEGNE